VGKPEGKILLGIPRRKWEDNKRESQMKTLNITIKFNGNIKGFHLTHPRIKMDLQEEG